MAKSRITGSSRRPAPAPAPQRRQTHTQAPPAPQHQAPPPQAPVQQTGGGGMGMMGNFASAAAGTVVGHTIARGLMGVMGGNDAPVEQQQYAQQPQQQDICNFQSQDFMRCMNDNGGSIDRCQYFLDQLNTCRRNAQQYQQ